jgi:nucleotide-binding universal stress UspA family protein
MPGHRRIVCGVNGAPSARGALLEAARRAADTGALLVVITAYDAVGWSWGALASLPGGDLLPVFGRRRIQAAEEATLRALVEDVLSDPGAAGVRELPAMELRAIPGQPADVLVRASAGADALVVGHGDYAGPLTSVAAACSRRARCPVVVVPTEHATAPRVVEEDQ